MQEPILDPDRGLKVIYTISVRRQLDLRSRTPKVRREFKVRGGEEKVDEKPDQAAEETVATGGVWVSGDVVGIHDGNCRCQRSSTWLWKMVVETQRA